MSKLIHSETGRTLRFANENICGCRGIRKRLYLENIDAGGVLYIYAMARPGCNSPMTVTVNGHSYSLPPDKLLYLHWFNLPLTREVLLPGNNSVELFCNDTHGWVLGLDHRSYSENSETSFDLGKTWHKECKGIGHFIKGEYVIRLRLKADSICDLSPPELVWESKDSLFLQGIRNIIPNELKCISDPWQQARALSTWVCSLWDYSCVDCIEYPPWEPLTIMSWTKTSFGQSSPKPVAFCVHFGVVFTSAALALGLPARNICCTDNINNGKGHFVSEVWIERWAKWCQIDPCCDLTYIRDGVGLSVAELKSEAARLGALASKGPGFERQTAVVQYARENFFTGKTFKFWALWPRNDYVSHQQLTPASHGTGAYAETDWLWLQDSGSELDMFPYHLPLSKLNSPPPDAWRNI